MTFEITVPERELVPDGEYPAKVAKVEARDGIHGPYVLLCYELEGLARADGSTFQVFQACSQKLTPGAKFRGVAEACMSRKLAPGEKISDATITGAEVRVKVSQGPDKSGEIHNTVEEVLPRS